MAVSQDFLEYVLDQLESLEDLSYKRMFGGVGIFSCGKIFALLAHDQAYFKVDDGNREKYSAQGSQAFQPFPDKPMVMSYYEVPAHILESPMELFDWAQDSLAITK